MDPIRLVVLLIVIVAVVAIAAWFVRSSGVVIPRPLMIAGYAVVAIIAILFVAGLAGIGPGLRLN